MLPMHGRLLGTASHVREALTDSSWPQMLSWSETWVQAAVFGFVLPPNGGSPSPSCLACLLFRPHSRADAVVVT